MYALILIVGTAMLSSVFSKEGREKPHRIPLASLGTIIFIIGATGLENMG